MQIGAQLANATAQAFDARKNVLALVQLRRLGLNFFERGAVRLPIAQPVLAGNQRGGCCLPCRRPHLPQFCQSLQIGSHLFEMLGCGFDERIIRLEVAAKILRMGQQRLQPIFGVNARHARFTNSLELWNEPMRIGGTLAQQPQPFGSSGRQPLDHVELRLEMYPSGKRLRVRGSGFEAHVSPPMMIGDTR
ncbi:hypothetical protein [Bradyrhizobium sp. JR7.2]|uniref:hypothetical protein n=1 Tax=Bradyrhizobium sp. JR7.2 TaxID=3156375 RepID=UPI0033999BCA